MSIKRPVCNSHLESCAITAVREHEFHIIFVRLRVNLAALVRIALVMHQDPDQHTSHDAASVVFMQTKHEVGRKAQLW